MIPLIPDVPDALREAAQIGKVVPFIGAGASRIGGCPDWVGFADKCFEVFLAKGVFSYSQLDQISKLGPRVKLSIALALQKEHGVPIEFRKILHPQGRKEDNGRRLYAALSKLATTFVTTNYGEWLAGC